MKANPLTVIKNLKRNAWIVFLILGLLVGPISAQTTVGARFSRRLSLVNYLKSKYFGTVVDLGFGEDKKPRKGEPVELVMGDHVYWFGLRDGGRARVIFEVATTTIAKDRRFSKVDPDVHSQRLAHLRFMNASITPLLGSASASSTSPIPSTPGAVSQSDVNIPAFESGDEITYNDLRKKEQSKGFAVVFDSSLFLSDGTPLTIRFEKEDGNGK